MFIESEKPCPAGPLHPHPVLVATSELLPARPGLHAGHTVVTRQADTCLQSGGWEGERRAEGGRGVTLKPIP